MNFAKRLLMVSGAVALAGIFGALLTPKTAHAVIATLVQVVGNVAVVNPVDANGNKVSLLGRDADNPALQPFQFSSFNAGGIFFEVPVPAGTRLVIENISVACFESPVNSNLDLRVSTVAGGVFGQYTSAFQRTGSSNEMIATQSGRLYADGGSTVTIATGFGVPAGSNCGASMSGYLVSTP